MKKKRSKSQTLTPSSADRWLNCSKSRYLEHLLPKSQSSYSKEGDAAHHLAELLLNRHFEPLRGPFINKALKKFKKQNEFYLASPKGMDAQIEKYTSFVIEEFTEVLSLDAKATITIEDEVDLSRYNIKNSGKIDALIVGNRKLTIIDLKYGKGFQVAAEDNAQLKVYALGAIDKYELIHDFDTVDLIIYQPRLNWISSDSWDVGELLDWGQHEVLPKSKIALTDKGETLAGDWCKWCSAKSRCRAFTAKFTKNIDLIGRDIDLLSDDELETLFNMIPLFNSWAGTIKAYMLNEALNGRDWETLKVVNGTGRRAWSDEDEVKKVLTEEGFKIEEITNTKLKGIGDITDMFSVDRGKEILEPLILKGLGGPKLVPLSDPRPEKGRKEAKDDFNDGSFD